MKAVIRHWRADHRRSQAHEVPRENHLEIRRLTKLLEPYIPLSAAYTGSSCLTSEVRCLENCLHHGPYINGNSEIGAHVRSNLCFSSVYGIIDKIESGHKSDFFFFIKKTNFLLCVRTKF